jgi:predicted branched-subunit amino acid permease
MPSRTVINGGSTPSDFKMIYQAIIDIFPLSLAVVPWGILCGSLAITVGLIPITLNL